jgi:hypothetical protein
MAKVDYGYELYFAAPVLRIYNEFGFRGAIDAEMKDLIVAKVIASNELVKSKTVWRSMASPLTGEVVVGIRRNQVMRLRVDNLCLGWLRQNKHSHSRRARCQRVRVELLME